MRIRPKPKIVCTLGTTTDDVEVLESMVRNGMNCARFNTAYATKDDYERRIDDLRSIANVPIMMDLKGPQVRVKADFNMKVKYGDSIMLGFGKGPFHFNKDFYDDVAVNDKIVFENGTIEAMVYEKDDEKHRISLFVTNPGDGNFHKDMGANIPGKYLNVDKLSKKDMEMIDFSIKKDVEYIALSFVRDKEDIRNIYEHIKRRTQDIKRREYNNEIGIVAKIEDIQGLQNIESILQYAKDEGINFGVMVARGDMYVELPMHEMPRYQKHLIKQCKKYGIPVVTATGFLESMTKQEKPTRAEVSDVANTVLDGSDAIMLSGETSNSHYPAEAVKMLSVIMNEYMTGTHDDYNVK